jgi:hypothetical protein
LVHYNNVKDADSQRANQNLNAKNARENRIIGSLATVAQHATTEQIRQRIRAKNRRQCGHENTQNTNTNPKQNIINKKLMCLLLKCLINMFIVELILFLFVGFNNLLKYFCLMEYINEVTRTIKNSNNCVYA